MDNVVIDTNSLIMAISSRSVYHKIWQSFLAGDHHFNVLRHIAFPVVDVISIDDFLKEVQSAYS